MTEAPQPPPPGGDQPPSPGAPGFDLAERWNIATWRRRSGYALGGATCILLGGLIYYSLHLLHEDGSALPKTEVEATYRIAELVAHAAITVAGVWFCFALLRVTERLVPTAASASAGLAANMISAW